MFSSLTDTRTPEQRRRIMSAVRQRGTAPELALRHALYRVGVRGWRCNYAKAPGRPDLAWPGLRFAVFVDGAFWHGHPSRHRPGRSGEYWDRKIEGNVRRDRHVDAELRESGWTVIRIWDFEVRKEEDETVRRVVEGLKAQQRDRQVPWLDRASLP
ncbi:MAG: very short patch repair endonuclease [Solirubrobacterales bacterium]